MAIICSVVWDAAGGQLPKFLSDDPVQTMPAPLPVQKPARSNINETADFFIQSARWQRRTETPSAAVNTIDEVPDSEWFTNRHGKRRLTRDELQNGPPGAAPIPPFTVISGKSEGIMPGFVMKDSMGRRYFVKSDPLSNPEMATGAEAIGSRFLYAIGYNTPRNEIAVLRLAEMRLSPDAKVTLAGGKPRQMTWKDVEQLVQQIPHYGDGSFRIVASLAIPGENIGPFLFEGTRADDPNDIIPHEERRDLRALYVFSAWLNHTDIKAGNTLDAVVEENGIRFIRHYLLDFASSLGSDGDAPKDPRLGHEFMLGSPGNVLRRIFTAGALPADWERFHYPKLKAAGHFEWQLFDPDKWKSDYPNPAFMSRLPGDEYWAAKQVMAFSDQDIRAIVDTARFSDSEVTEYIIKALEARRDAIGRTFFSRTLPLDHFRIGNGRLLFDDLAVVYGFHAPRPYAVRWSGFDNISQTHRPIPTTGSTDLPTEIIASASGSYFSATIGAPGEPYKRVTIYVRKEQADYKLVGVEHSW